MKNTSIDTELKEAITTYRTQYTLLTNITTIFVIANVTFIGFGLKNIQTPEIIMLGAIFPFLILIARIKSSQLMLPIIYSAINLEKELHTNFDWVASTYFRVMQPKKWIIIEKILELPNQNERILELRRLNNGFKMIFSKSKLLVTILCLSFIIIQIVLPVFMLMK